jgi:hypothetical protein
LPLKVNSHLRLLLSNYDHRLAAASTSSHSDEAIAHLKSLALQAKTEGDMAKAKEYLIQMKVRVRFSQTASFSTTL